MSAALSLLPENASAFERDMGALTAAIDAIDPAAIETIWDAWSCPASLLPWLASALSVDLWDDRWNEVRKRQAIADSPAWHRLKGTRAAVELAVGLVARRALVIEWFERIPPARRGTALVIGEPAPGDDPIAVAAAARRMTTLAKPKSRAVGVSVGLIMEHAGPIALAVGVLAAMTIEPQPRTLPEVAVALQPASGVLADGRMRIEPRIAPRAAPAPAAVAAPQPLFAFGLLNAGPGAPSQAPTQGAAVSGPQALFAFGLLNAGPG